MTARHTLPAVSPDRLAEVLRPHRPERILFCGPWIGEFGFEVVWQGTCCRKAASGAYDLVLACSYPASGHLYSTFAHAFVPHAFERRRMRDKAAGTPDNPLGVLDHGDLRAYAAGLVPPGAEIFLPDQTFMETAVAGEPRAGGLYRPLQGPPVETGFDLIIHARDKRDAFSRGINLRYNWPLEKWNALTGRLAADGLTIGAIGTAAFHPDHTVDLRHLPLEKTVSYIRESRLVVGPSSGPMHLAQLCGREIVVWFGADALVARYTTRWNFQDAPRTIVQRQVPEVDEVYAAVTTALAGAG